MFNWPGPARPGPFRSGPLGQVRPGRSRADQSRPGRRGAASPCMVLLLRSRSAGGGAWLPRSLAAPKDAARRAALANGRPSSAPSKGRASSPARRGPPGRPRASCGCEGSAAIRSSCRSKSAQFDSCAFRPGFPTGWGSQYFVLGCSHPESWPLSWSSTLLAAAAAAAAGAAAAAVGSAGSAIGLSTASLRSPWTA